MPTTNFQELFESLKTGIAGLAATSVTGFVNEATADGRNILEAMKGELERWTKAVVNGDLTADDMAFLVAGRVELNEMHGLERLGVAKIELEKFRNGIVDLIVGAVGKVVKGL